MIKISVILPVYNEEKYITECLESLSNQTVMPQEIIVIDDGSTDSSKSKVNPFDKLRVDAERSRSIKSQKSKLQLKTQKLIILEQEHQGPAIARNLGAKHAKGGILVFLDADMVYDKDYIRELIQPIIDKKEIATFTRSEYVANLDNVWAKLWDETTYGNLGKRSVYCSRDRETAFRAILASEFTKVGGFDNSGYSDDSSVLTKLKKSAASVDTAVCHHFNPSYISEVFFSARWMGRSINNRGKFLQFAIFSPPWSILKAVVGSVLRKNVRFFPFRLVFDFGYFIGLVDVHLRRNHYK